MKKTVLICGSFTSTRTQAKLKALEAIIRALVEAGYKIRNANGKYVGQYITMVILKIAAEKHILPSEICEQHVPLQKEVMEELGIENDVFTQLSAYHQQQMIITSPPDAYLYIGGQATTYNEWQMCKDDNSRLCWLGIPQFGGSGQEIYEYYKILFLNDKEKFSLYEQVGADAYDLFNTNDVGTHVVSMLDAMTA